MWRHKVGLFLFMFVVSLPAYAQNVAYEFVAGDCFFDPSEDAAVECGTLIVPEDRSNPTGNQVRIAVAIFRAQGDDPAPDPIFYLDGGPGANTLDRLGTDLDRFPPFNQDRDVVLLDYRGTGRSEPNLSCQEIVDYSREADSDELSSAYNDGYLAALESCRVRLVDDERVNLGMYSIAVLAQDIVDLRDALGYEQINLFGASYGTRLALTLLRDHPEGIRSVILDGVTPPQNNPSTDSLMNANSALEELFSACGNASVCNEAFPNVRAQFYTAARKLNKQPATINIWIPSVEESQDVEIDGNTFVSIVIASMYSTDVIPWLPFIISEVNAGNYELMSSFVDTVVTSRPSITAGLFLALGCNDRAPFSVVEGGNMDETASGLAEFFAAQGDDHATEVAIDFCASWGLAASGSIVSEPAQSDVPVLILNGQFDPVTPPRLGEMAAQTLPNSTVLTILGAGHVPSLTGSACARELAAAFIADPRSRLDTSCVDDAAVTWKTADPSETLRDFGTLLQQDPVWELISHDYSLFWNSATWFHITASGWLDVTDYLFTSPDANATDSRRFSPRYMFLERYELIAECETDGLYLYEFTSETDFSEYRVRSWVDARRADRIRTVNLEFHEDDIDLLNTYSQLLFSKLPACNGQ
jgi:pimeloyl-ACP methyl ester carboxylesterase